MTKAPFPVMPIGTWTAGTIAISGRFAGDGNDCAAASAESVTHRVSVPLLPQQSSPFSKLAAST